MRSWKIAAGPALALLVACGAQDDPSAAADGARVFGNVVYAREAPAPRLLTITDEQAAGCCGDPSLMDRTDRSLLVDPDTRGIANVVVTLDVPGAPFTIPSEPVEITARGCRFEPHVTALPAGAAFVVLDDDADTAHNFHVHDRPDRSSSRTRRQEDPLIVRPRSPEPVMVTCDLHPWMKAWVHVTGASHFAVTDASGSFALEGVPPGTYRMKVWHEALGTHVADVVVVPDAPPEPMRIPLDRPAPSSLRQQAGPDAVPGEVTDGGPGESPDDDR